MSSDAQEMHDLFTGTASKYVQVWAWNEIGRLQEQLRQAEAERAEQIRIQLEQSRVTVWPPRLQSGMKIGPGHGREDAEILVYFIGRSWEGKAECWECRSGLLLFFYPDDLDRAYPRVGDWVRCKNVAHAGNNPFAVTRVGASSVYGQDDFEGSGCKFADLEPAQREEGQAPDLQAQADG